VAVQHLRRNLRHAEKCKQRCAAGCGFTAFDEWLEGPVTAADLAADKRRKERLAALLGRTTA
jgi:hypothetical protein